MGCEEAWKIRGAMEAGHRTLFSWHNLCQSPQIDSHHLNSIGTLYIRLDNNIVRRSVTILTPLRSRPVNHVLCSIADTIGCKSL